MSNAGMPLLLHELFRAESGPFTVLVFWRPGLVTPCGIVDNGSSHYARLVESNDCACILGVQSYILAADHVLGPFLLAPTAFL